MKQQACAPQPQALSRGVGGAATRDLGTGATRGVSRGCPCLCNFLTEQCWLTGCCLPCFASCGVNTATICCFPCATRLPTSCWLGMERMQNTIHNQLALWTMQHPEPSAGCPWYMGGWGFCGCCGFLQYCLSVYTYVDGAYHIVLNHEEVGKLSDGRTTYLRREAWFGETYGLSGKLCVSDAGMVNRQLLDGPMDRGFFLGVHWLRGPSLPSFSDGSKSFPLALPSGVCPMNDGAHATFHATFRQLLWNEAAAQRLRGDDRVVRAAAAELKKNFDTLKGRFDGGVKDGFQPGGPGFDFVDLFCTRLLHWGLFGIDMGEDTTSSVYQTATWASRKVPATAQHLEIPPGGIIGALSAAEIRTKTDFLFEMYMGSPALKDYAPFPPAEVSALDPLTQADLNGHPPKSVSKEDFVRELMPAIIIAGLLGPKTLGRVLVAPFFGGTQTGPVATEEERSLPLCAPEGFEYPYGDDQRLKLCILEALRLNPAVYETVYKLSEARRVEDYAGLGSKTFPKGCSVLLSYVNTGVDAAQFGATARRWDPYGHAAALDGPESTFNGFNGVGSRGQRVCPGRDLTIVMLTHLLNAIGGKLG